MLDRAEKRQHDEAGKDEGETRPGKRSRRESGQVSPQETCIFDCGKTGNLCRGSRYQLDSYIREAALKIGDTKLLAKLAAGDVIAFDVIYRKGCLVDLYNKAKQVETQQTSSDSDLGVYGGIAFSELVMYLEEKLSEEPHVVKLAEVVSLYQRRLEEFGQKKEVRENSTRLKEKLLAHIPGLTAHKK